MAERKSDLAFAAFFGSGKSGGGGGGSVTVDAALSASSENPVQNKVINAALATKGTYSKPSGGIPKSDLASAVQTSLGKADDAVLYTVQALTDEQKVLARQNIGSASAQDMADVKIRLDDIDGGGNWIEVTSEDEMVDHNQIYLYNGTLWRWETRSIPITVIGPSTASIVPSKRFSHGSQAFVNSVGQDSLIIPLESSGTSQVFQIRDSNGVMVPDKSYTAAYYGTVNDTFPNTATRTANGNLVDIKNVAAGNQFVVFMLKHNSDYSGAALTVDGTAMEFSVGDTPTAAFGEATTEYEDVSDFYDTGRVPRKDNDENLEAYISSATAPRPQLPATDAAGSDIDLNSTSTTVDDLYALIDASVTRYPKYAHKIVLGKDASGTYDVCKYVLGKAYWEAWVKVGYGRMYAWKSGNSMVYSSVISPRTGDTMWSSVYVGGTSAGTVTAVNGENQSRAVGNTIYVRSEADDVAPTMLYHPIYDPVPSRYYELRDGQMEYVCNYSSGSGDTITMNKAYGTFTRCPEEDLDVNLTKRIPVAIFANEHGGNEQRDMSLVAARLIKALCEGGLDGNPVLKFLREKCVLSVIPVVNPWGWMQYPNSTGYRNSNGVNINRNYDTPGWEVYKAANPSESGLGEYPGSEIETQYVMNTLALLRPSVAISVHGLTSSASAGAVMQYQGQNPSGQYSAYKINLAREGMMSGYEIKLTPYNPLECPPESTAKAPSYITKIGAYGGIVEFFSRDPQATEYCTPFVMEQQFSYLLKMIAMFISDWQDRSASVE